MFLNQFRRIQIFNIYNLTNISHFRDTKYKLGQLFISRCLSLKALHLDASTFSMTLAMVTSFSSVLNFSSSKLCDSGLPVLHSVSRGFPQVSIHHSFSRQLYVKDQHQLFLPSLAVLFFSSLFPDVKNKLLNKLLSNNKAGYS